MAAFCGGNCGEFSSKKTSTAPSKVMSGCHSSSTSEEQNSQGKTDDCCVSQSVPNHSVATVSPSSETDSKKFQFNFINSSVSLKFLKNFVFSNAPPEQGFFSKTPIYLLLSRLKIPS